MMVVARGRTRPSRGGIDPSLDKKCGLKTVCVDLSNYNNCYSYELNLNSNGGLKYSEFILKENSYCFVSGMVIILKLQCFYQYSWECLEQIGFIWAIQRLDFSSSVPWASCFWVN